MKSLVEVKEKHTLFAKIRKFLKRLFYKEEIEDKSNYDNNKKQLSTKFKENIEIKPDLEKIRIIELQTKFKNGEIAEEDIDDEDYEKLLDLYDEQNNKIKEDIEKYKKEIQEIVMEMKGKKL